MTADERVERLERSVAELEEVLLRLGDLVGTMWLQIGGLITQAQSVA